MTPTPAFDWDRERGTIRRPSLSNFGAEERREAGELVDVLDVVGRGNLRGVRRVSAAEGSWGRGRVLGVVGLARGGMKRDRNAENGEEGERGGDVGAEEGGEERREVEWHDRDVAELEGDNVGGVGLEEDEDNEERGRTAFCRVCRSAMICAIWRPSVTKDIVRVGFRLVWYEVDVVRIRGGGGEALRGRRGCTSVGFMCGRVNQ